MRPGLDQPRAGRVGGLRLSQTRADRRQTPAAALLLTAYAGVEELVCDRDLAHMKAELAARYATLVYNVTKALWGEEPGR